MKNPAAETLFNFLASEPELIKKASQVLFIRPVAHPRLSVLKELKPACLQTFKPEAERLAIQGYRIINEMQGEFDFVIYLPGQQRDENLYNFARAVTHLKDAGTLICSLSNDLGSHRFEKHLQELLGDVNSYSRNKCRVFWGVKTCALSEQLRQDWLKLGELTKIEGTEIFSCPGVFSRKKIDLGSKLLCENLPCELPGRGADLGAGYGYISHYLVKHATGISALHLYEAEKLALDAARTNLASLSPEIELSYEWHDVVSGLVHRNLDWIVTNPPFHQGKASAISLGQRFVEVAGASLRPGGRLFMVANQNLPYLPLLDKNFQSAQVIAEAAGFRVLAAQK